MRFRGIKIKGSCQRLGESQKIERKSERLKDIVSSECGLIGMKDLRQARKIALIAHLKRSKLLRKLKSRVRRERN